MKYDELDTAIKVVIFTIISRMINSTMTALSKQFSPSFSSQSQQKMSATERLASNPRRTRSRQSTSKSINLTPQALPTNLQFLLRFQQATSVVTFGLVGIALAVYGWTVYTPRVWSQEFKQLKTLQVHERQLVATNEMLKNQLAKQAEKPNSGLIRPTPHYNVFLPSGKEMATPDQQSSANQPSKLILGNQPLAY